MTLIERAPDDTIRVLETLIDEAQKAMKHLPLMERLLLTGALLDAVNLLDELKEKNPS